MSKVEFVDKLNTCDCNAQTQITSGRESLTCLITNHGSLPNKSRNELEYIAENRDLMRL